MARKVIRTGYDTYAGQPAPAQNHATSTYYRLEANEPNVGEYRQQNAYLYMPNPLPKGATLVSATLTLYAWKASTGSTRTVTVARIGEQWKVGQLNWNNRPSVVANTDVTVTVGDLSDGEAITIDVSAHVQAWANGAPDYGWRITTNAQVPHYIHSLEGAKPPTLTVEWSDAPSAPTNLRPSGGAVGELRPILQFDYTDVSGRTELGAVQVQIDADKSGSPDYDSGAVSTTVPELDLGAQGYAGLPSTPTYWRVRVQDAAGLWSPWSPWSESIYFDPRPGSTIPSDAPPGTPTPLPGVTITNPPTSGLVTEPTPPITWTFGGTQTAWRVRVGPASDYTVITHDSGKRTGTETSYTLPSGVLTSTTETYSVRVDVWDNVPRVASPGVPIYSGARRDFSMTTDPNVSGVTGLQIVSAPDEPKVTLTWQRGTMPDGWSIWRNGQVIAAGIDAADLLVSGTTYQWIDYGPPANTTLTYTVRAVVSGAQSQGTATASTSTKARGIWLINPATGASVVLAGDEPGEWSMPDEATTYVPLGAQGAIRVVGGMRGYEGTMSGMLIDGFLGRSLDAQLATLWEFKSNPSDELRLTVGDISIPVVIGDIVVAPTPLSRAPDQLLREVSFSFWQTGEYAFTPHV